MLYFPARFDHWAIQEGDGHAARAGGVFAVSTDAQGAWWDEEGEEVGEEVEQEGGL